jgi:TolB-like protein/DNA-binding winged helix-turn-helix (wHTH) protein/tetratricopeptide (TPR) repeat protein
VPTLEELQKGFQLGDWEVIPARRELRRGDEVARPEPKQLKVLLSLAQRDGDVVTRDELVAECWDDRPTADEPINRCISQLRKHLGDEKPYHYIDALVKAGYCLKQPVILKDPDEPIAAPVIIETRKTSRIWAIVAVLAITIFLSVVFRDKGPHSIAVLPFSNLSGDPELAYLASGFKEELVHTLQTVPELAIKNVRMTYEEPISEVGKKLGADSVLTGSLRIEGQEMRVSYQLVDVDNDVILESGQVSGLRDDLFDLQIELARMVRIHIVGESNQQLLSLSRPENPAAYDRYILGQHLLERRGIAGNLEDAIALFEEYIELDPSYGPAFLALAEIHVLLPDYRGYNIAEQYEIALQTVREGIAADPAIEDAAAAVFGFVYHKEKKWIEAEEAFIKATTSPVVESNAFNWYSLLLGGVGRSEESLRQVLAAFEIDPSSAVINSRIAIVYTWAGDDVRAAGYFERSRQLGAGGATHLLANALHLKRIGKVDEARILTKAGVAAGGGATEWVDLVFEGLADPANVELALSALDQAAADNEVEPRVEATLRIMLGDTDGALRVARILVNPGQIYETDFLFLPEFKSLHARPEFLELMGTLGITDYWEQAGCVWKDLAVDCS